MSGSSSSDEELIVIALALEEEEEPNRRRFWVHEINQSRNRYGEYHTLFGYLKRDNVKFFQYFRMSYEKFCDLLKLIEPDIKKNDTNFREAISPEERLAVTMRYLGHGGSYRVISFSYRLGETTVRNIVHTTCQAIWKNLSPIVMPPPIKTMWERIEEGFANKWNYPNCIGSLDGKHVVTEKPPNSGSLYYNYKKDFSVVLMALVDSDTKFITVDVGAYGKNSDGAVFRDSQLGKQLFSNNLDLPPPKVLPNTNIILPHVVIADEAFPLSEHIMRPFPGPQVLKNEPNKIYNYRHSRARRTVENAFGILSKKFRVYIQKFQISPEHIDIIVLATTCLHNYLRDDADRLWQPGELEKRERNAGMQNLVNVGGNATLQAFNIRDNFKNYFNSPEGSVPWQRDMIYRGRRQIPPRTGD